MLSSTSSTAATITVGETIAFLDGSVSSVARGISENRYALWLGSGISRGRVDGLDKLIRRVLTQIHQRSLIVSIFCIAILALEGCAADIATANWDGLIEIALEKLSGRGRVLRVCVLGEDLRIEPLRSNLYKFHGCAVRARLN